MPRVHLTRSAALAGAIAALLFLAVAAEAALVRVNDIVLHADGGFQPRNLPPNRFAPIEFQGFFDIAAKRGGRPVALEEAVIDFDRDGHLDVAGLPTCAPARIEAVSTSAARGVCRGALVGSGQVEAIVDTSDGPAPVISPLALFNGPPQEGNPTVVFHTHSGLGRDQTIAIVVPIERRAGPFRYRATLVFPPIDEGRGSISRVQVEIGRRFGPGNRRSYVSARCRDHVLETHGRFRFADGTIVDGSVQKGCTPILPRPGR